MFDELVEIICNYVDVQPADVHEESRFMEDLGFTSFDFMSMLGEIEDTFDVEIEQTKAAEIRTVQEAVDYLDIKRRIMGEDRRKYVISHNSGYSFICK